METALNTFGQPISQAGGSIVPTAPTTDQTNARERAVVSTTPARDAVQSSITTLNNYTTNAANVQAAKAAAAPAEATSTQGSKEEPPLTLIDPTTLQSVQFASPSINKDNINAYLAKGYQIDGGAVPPGVNVTGAAGAPDNGYGKAVSDLQALSSQLDTVQNVTPAQQAVIQSIKQQFEQRKTQMADSNARGQASLTQFGIASGANRGSASFDGIISGEERAGVQRLADLDAQETQAVAAAEQAFKSDNLKLLTTKIQAAQDIADRKQKEMETLQKNAFDYNKMIFDAQQKEKEALTKSLSDVLTGLSPDAPPDVRVAVSQAPDLATAVQAAGEYLKAGTGIVGEYQYYKTQAIAAGQTPVDFNTYQNIDTNRKKSIAQAGAASASGLNNTTLTKVQTIANQLDSEQTVKQYQTIAQTIAAVKNSGSSPTDDIQRVYAFAKVMDPNSAVREGEYKTVQEYAQALYQHVGIKIARVFTNTGFLTPEARKMMNATLDSRLQAVESSYNSIRNSYASRINKLTGASDGIDYLTDYKQPTTGEDLVRQEKDAQDTVVSYLAAHPDKRSEVEKAMKATNPTTGKPLTAQEFLQAFPEYADTSTPAANPRDPKRTWLF